MASLKSFLPKLSECLRMSPAALYERQRALVRLGVLTERKGRGPGSGVELTADALAALLTSLLVTDNLSEVDDRVDRLLKAPVDAERLLARARGRASTFGEMLTGILTSRDPEDWAVLVHRQKMCALVNSLLPDDDDNTWELSFGGYEFSIGPGIVTEATLGLWATLIRAFQSAASK